MTNEEKAQEISKDFYMPDTGFNREDLYESAMEMADWKDKQFKEYLEACIKVNKKYNKPKMTSYIEAMIKDLEL